MFKDILLDEDGDLKISNGDFVIGDSNTQEIEALLISKKGMFKEFPLTGADLERLVKARAGQTAAIKEIKKQLVGDGFNEDDIQIDNADLTVNANRKN